MFVCRGRTLSSSASTQVRGEFRPCLVRRSKEMQSKSDPNKNTNTGVMFLRFCLPDTHRRIKGAPSFSWHYNQGATIFRIRNDKPDKAESTLAGLGVAPRVQEHRSTSEFKNVGGSRRQVFANFFCNGGFLFAPEDPQALDLIRLRNSSSGSIISPSASIRCATVPCTSLPTSCEG